MGKARTAESKALLKELSRQTNNSSPSIRLTWSQALHKMYRENPELIRADYRIADAKEEQDSAWKDLTPSLTLSGSDTKSLANLGDLLGNPSLRVHSFISLGNLLDYPKRIYTKKFLYIGSQLQAELTMRQQVIKLYRLFQKGQLLDQEKQALDFQANLAKQTAESQIEIAAATREYLVAKRDYAQRRGEWEREVGDFYMNRYSKVTLVTSSLPSVKYKPSELNFYNTKRWGALQVNLLALEKIAEEGRIKDVYSRFLPRLNIGVSAPPIYSNTANDSFKLSNTTLSPYAHWSLDTRGNIRKQVHRLWRDDPLKQWIKDKRRADEVQKLLEGKIVLALVQKERRSIAQARTSYSALVKGGLIDDLQKAVSSMRVLKEKELGLTAKEIELSTELWLIDDSRWGSITRQWNSSRQQRLIKMRADIKRNKPSFWKALTR
mgnify:CR=1 FL=1